MKQFEALTKTWDFEISRVSTYSVLGLQVNRIGKHEIHFSQENYIEELIKEFNCQDLPAVFVPLRNGIEKDYNPENMSKDVDPSIPYRRLNMKLYWIARCYRVHIMYACNFFARFGNCYNEDLYKEMLKTVLYLKGTIKWKLIFKVNPNVVPDIVFSIDAGFSVMADRKSTQGVFGWVGDCLIYGSSGTIKSMVTSSCESESHAIFEGAKAAVFLRNWLVNFFKVKDPTFLFNDNEAAISILSTRNNQSLSKHFDIKLRYVTELVEKGKIKIYHINRALNAADILTHSLPRSVYEALLHLIYGPDGVKGLLKAAAISSGGDLKSMYNKSLWTVIVLNKE